MGDRQRFTRIFRTLVTLWSGSSTGSANATPGGLALRRVHPTFPDPYDWPAYVAKLTALANRFG